MKVKKSLNVPALSVVKGNLSLIRSYKRDEMLRLRRPALALAPGDLEQENKYFCPNFKPHMNAKIASFILRGLTERAKRALTKIPHCRLCIFVKSRY